MIFKIGAVVLTSILLFITTISFVDTNKVQKAGKADRPNVIIILTDDQGYGDVGFNGCKDIPTPNIDRISKKGFVFTQAYVTFAVCAPI